MREPTPDDCALLEKMRSDPPGTARTAQERIAFERWWDWTYEQRNRVDN